MLLVCLLFAIFAYCHFFCSNLHSNNLTHLPAGIFLNATFLSYLYEIFCPSVFYYLTRCHTASDLGDNPLLTIGHNWTRSPVAGGKVLQLSLDTSVVNITSRMCACAAGLTGAPFYCCGCPFSLFKIRVFFSQMGCLPCSAGLLGRHRWADCVPK